MALSLSPLIISPRGVFAVHDTGAPGTSSYHTLVIIHGLSWHANVFSRLVPFAPRHNCRLILVNRRGYPGATPFSAEELRDLGRYSSDDSPASHEGFRAFCRERGREVYDFLAELVSSDQSITTEGGVSIAGWSSGAMYTMAFLAYAPAFAAAREFDLQPYMHSVISYDPPDVCLGYPFPEGSWDPFQERGISMHEIITKVFPTWVTSHFKHDESSRTLEYSRPLVVPPSSLGTLPQSTVCAEATAPGGVDTLYSSVLVSSTGVTVAKEMKDAVVYRSDSQAPGWGQVLLKHIWCDHSSWHTVYCAWCFEDEWKAAREAGTLTRPVEFVRFRRANHFPHWDYPEPTLAVLLGEWDGSETTSLRSV